ncbi:MAG: hypothetical protein Fur0023_19380 [Bacteroidia bacterium]
MNTYIVYALYSEKYNKIYIGYTSNLDQRILSHNILSKKGWTRKYRPWEVFYTEEFTSKSEAIVREKYLKSGVGRKFIKQQLEHWKERQ